MSEFWNNHRKGILGFLGGAFVMVGMTAATLGCNRLPPPFSQLCLAVAQSAVDQVKQQIVDAAGDGGSAPSSPSSSPASALELCPGAPGGDLCLSTGYALPLPDGGACRCR